MLLPHSLGYLTLVGDLDCGCSKDLSAALGQLAGSDVAVLDFSRVGFCDSTAINALVGLRRSMLAAGRGGEVRIVRPPRSLRQVLEVCNLDGYFTICDGAAEEIPAAGNGEEMVTFVGGFDAGGYSEVEPGRDI